MNRHAVSVIMLILYDASSIRKGREPDPRIADSPQQKKTMDALMTGVD